MLRSALMKTWTAGELAAALGLPLRGDPARILTGAAMLEDAGPETIGVRRRAEILCAPPRNREPAASLRCLNSPGGRSRFVIQSTRPRAHFAYALTLLYTGRAIRAGVDGFRTSGCRGGGGSDRGSGAIREYRRGRADRRADADRGGLRDRAECRNRRGLHRCIRG